MGEHSLLHVDGEMDTRECMRLARRLELGLVAPMANLELLWKLLNEMRSIS